MRTEPVACSLICRISAAGVFALAVIFAASGCKSTPAPPSTAPETVEDTVDSVDAAQEGADTAESAAQAHLGIPMPLRGAEAAETLMVLADSPAEPNELQALVASIWAHLSALSFPELHSREASAPTATARAWWMLARQINNALTATDRFRAWQRWRAGHPGHPAAGFPPPSVRQATEPERIALLVPLNGDFGPAGEAVRDGFLAAYLHAGETAQRIRVYDTSAMSVRGAYDLAQRDGADLIVGPLQKTAVAALAALGPDVPAIALNHLDTGAPATANMVQFSLAVEDQAAAIADALVADEVERIVLFDSPARWSTRTRTRLEDAIGGIETVAFGTFYRIDEVTNVVGDALLVAESNARAREIGTITGTRFEFTPRRRDDIDAIVALVDAEDFLSLKPALDFHFAGELPVYAPATANLGNVDLARLEGISVSAIPWDLEGDPLASAVRSAFPASRGSYSSLFALGVDGFRLANQLARLTVDRASIPGSTGVLSLGDDGRIRRELVWTTVRDGRLRPSFDEPD